MSNIKEKLGAPVGLRTQEKALIEEVNQLLLTTSTKETELLRDLNLKTSLSVKTERYVELTEVQKLTAKHGELFTIAQIRNLALTYNLRFLPIRDYKEEVPQYLGTELIKAADEIGFVGYDLKHNLGQRTFVLAPANHFNLVKGSILIDLRTPAPSDPAVFISVGKDMYKLVYSWGSDLNLFNLVAGVVKHNPISLWISWLVPALVALLPTAYLFGMVFYLAIGIVTLILSLAQAMAMNSNMEVWNEPKTNSVAFKILWPWS